MKNKFLILIASLLSVGALVGCGDQKVEAFVTNLTEESYQGQIEGLQESYMSGDPINFSVQVTPEYKDYFDIDKVTLNGASLTRVRKEGDKHYYSGTAIGGENKVGAYFKIKPEKNIVQDFKLNISDELFDYVIGFDQSSKSNPGSIDNLDFRRDGIEQFRAPLLYNNDHYEGKAGKKIDGEDFFFNCVDGDTTHMESFNLKYTVKIRYLMVDTQESTSQMEEWGLSGSYFSKYTFWGEFGQENQKDAHYEEKIKALYTTEELKRLTGGATHIILLSESMAAHSATATLDEVKEVAGEDPSLIKGKYGSSTDGNGRDLCLVWYAKSTKAKPSKDEFRCLNLELVFEGYSNNAAVKSKHGSYYYEHFDMAQLSAEANKRHMHSGEKDPYYWYYDDTENYKVREMPLYRLYNNGTIDNADIGFLPDSGYCDKMRFWKIEGYVSRKVGNAFYIQDKPSYTPEEIAVIKSGDPNRTYGFGIYAFTYSNNSLEAGQHVRVVGALSSYGGAYQLQGLSFTDHTPNPNRDTVILDYENGQPKLYDIVPIEMTGEEFHVAKAPQLLVQIKNNIYFNRFTDDQYDYLTDEEKVLYDSDPEKYAYLRYTDINLGGRREINPMSQEYYRMYNNNNATTIFGSYGDIDNDPSSETYGQEIDKSEEYKETIHTGDTFRKGTQFFRIYLDQEVSFKWRGEEHYSFKFFTGGELSYHTKGPKYIGEEGTQTVTFSRKYCDQTKNGGVIGISNGYISTSGKTLKMQLTVVNAYDISGCLTKVA